MTYSLYVKQQNQTGLKYLGRTERNPDTYKGSGTYWKAHLKKHGDDVSTYVIGSYDTLDELKIAGLYYSKVWNVVESNDWANLVEESGDGVPKGTHHSQEHNQKMRLAMLGKKHSEETKRLLRQNHNPLSNPVPSLRKGKTGVYSEKTLQNMSLAQKGKSKPSRLKGRSFDEIYGSEKAIKMRKN